MAIELVLNRDTKAALPFDPSLLSCHSAILAQSGSGKSFMLGRLIEEIVSKTKARIIVLDPNSDFVRIPEVNEGAWNAPPLTPWFYPGEGAAAFSAAWKSINKLVLSQRNLEGVVPPKIDWGSLSDADRAGAMNIDARADPELYWCLVLASQLAMETWDASVEPAPDFAYFQNEVEIIGEFLQSGKGPKAVRQNPLAATLKKALGSGAFLRFRAIVSEIANYELWRGTGEAQRDLHELLLEVDPLPQLVVADLLSLSTDEERIVLASRVVEAVWANARSAFADAIREPDQPDTRVPTFLVIDEAHNLVPAVRESAAKERFAAQVTRVAAEGRKFGLHLIVVSQRPRRLDASILTECDNLFLMRMTSAKDIEYACEAFGFIRPDVAKNASGLKQGEVLLSGVVGRGDIVCHVAPRRTVEGGRSVPKTYWTVR